jgi:hypothetical protein
MAEEKSIDAKIREIIERIGDPCKFSEEEGSSVLLADKQLSEVVEKGSKYYLRPEGKRDSYIYAPKSIRKDWEEIEVERIESAYPYFITRAGIHYDYTGESSDLGYVYKKGEIERIAPKDAEAYRMRYDSFERHDYKGERNAYDIALIDFYKTKKSEKSGKDSKYSPIEISSALKKLNLQGLEAQILNALGGKK